jgi:hypothetical protein
LVALLVSFALYFTNPFFTVLDDETSIITAANAPIVQTLSLFVSGQGQHEHPPLSDLVLHFWLPIAETSPSVVRVPSILFYAAALVVFATVARKLSGDAAFYATLVVEALWPFGFHFGRMAGWYSFCFLLIALLTLAYVRFLDAPSWRRWLLVMGASFALVTSNYFGWAVVALIGFDAVFVLRDPDRYKYLGSGLIILIVGYGPLWRVLRGELYHYGSPGVSSTVRSRVLNGGFNLYTLFVSESVAPWCWRMSLLAGIAVAIALGCMILLTSSQGRRFYVGFGILFTVMAAMGVILTKRLLFISGWLLVAMGIALANHSKVLARRLLVGSLAVIAALGWTGIITRKYYSAQHFIEPWSIVADDAARQIGRGEMIISNNPSFLFYLNASLRDSGLLSTEKPEWAIHPSVVSLLQFPMPTDSLKGKSLFVRGVNTSAPERTASAERWMLSHCRLESTTKLLYDTGFEFKKRYFGINGQDPYRITLEQFDCGKSK